MNIIGSQSRETIPCLSDCGPIGVPAPPPEAEAALQRKKEEQKNEGADLANQKLHLSRRVTKSDGGGGDATEAIRPPDSLASAAPRRAAAAPD